MRPIEEVTWEDHYSSDDWTTDIADLENSVYVTTVGYRLKETKTKLILAQNVSTSGQISGTMTLLKKTIKTRKVINEASA